MNRSRLKEHLTSSCRLMGLALVVWCVVFCNGFLVYGQTNATAEVSVEGGATNEDGIRLNFRDAPLDTVLDYLSEAAGFVIVKEVDVEGTVDILSHQPLDKDEVVALLNTVLKEEGYAAIRNGRTLIIVDQDDAAQRNIPVKAGNDPDKIPSTDEMVTHVIPIRYADATKLVENLDPLLPEYATLSANESSNAIVLTDTQANVKRMVEIVQALDTSIASISVVRVFPLRYADAAELAKVVNEIFKIETTSSSRRSDGRSGFERFFRRGDDDSSRSSGDSEAKQAASRVVAVADENTNSLVVSAPADLMPNIEDLVTEVDTVSDDITAVRVFPLRYADATEMVTVIRDLFQSTTTRRSSGSSSSRRSFWFSRGSSRSSDNDQSSERKLEEETVTAVADERTNSVIVSASRDTLDEIAKMIEALDNNPAKEKKVFVYKMENADVESVAEILEGVFGAQSTNRNRNTTNRTNTNRNNTSRNSNSSTRNNSTRNSSSRTGTSNR